MIFGFVLRGFLARLYFLLLGFVSLIGGIGMLRKHPEARSRWPALLSECRVIQL
jgi:hypothetical protein